ncbi:hypothetical protein GGD83_004854 [Rhodoblastus sphagnicola]|uniref:hypothetical protein n=1 Tax=Rhodoblastus sphagnicola TaxID=333368 RepID=UPI001304FDAF|nr:hypothetical protein [Rhodoblastus sphagnicola]MBB4201024.1 hypothetical protein [Rhodoblastus sphagnicola]
MNRLSSGLPRLNGLTAVLLTLGHKCRNLGATAAAAAPNHRNTQNQVLFSLDWTS